MFARIDGGRLPLNGNGAPIFEERLNEAIARLNLARLDWFERRRYVLNCNWKVFVDNYLDGGYHVPHLHKGLDSVLDYSEYTIENGERYCLQSSPMVSRDDEVGAVRAGHALYYWLYPNFMLNYYDGVLDTNLVGPSRSIAPKSFLIFTLPTPQQQRAHAICKASMSVKGFRTKTSIFANRCNAG